MFKGVGGPPDSSSQNFNFVECLIEALSLIGRIKILTYCIRGRWVNRSTFLYQSATRSCDLLDWFIQKCFSSTS